jgi:hypothetical protein
MAPPRRSATRSSIAALNEAFGPATNGPTCLVGTAKTHVGHLDIAAGVTGLIKTALSLKHGVIPALLHYPDRPNPRLEVEGSALAPAAHRVEWKPGEAPRRAGVSAFGVGGTNVHMVLEEAPADPARRQPLCRLPDRGRFRSRPVLPEALAAAVGAAGRLGRGKSRPTPLPLPPPAPWPARLRAEDGPRCRRNGRSCPRSPRSLRPGHCGGPSLRGCLPLPRAGGAAPRNGPQPVRGGTRVPQRNGGLRGAAPARPRFRSARHHLPAKARKRPSG